MPGAEAIAIVGRGCVLPGALDPDALWELLRAGDDALSEVDPARWPLPVDEVLARPVGGSHHAVAGYVRDFAPALETWLSHHPEVDADRIRSLDPVFQWTWVAAAQALHGLPRGRAGAVLGNLSYPSAALGRLAGALDDGDPLTGPLEDRFCSSGPGTLVAETLGLDLGAMALDAACASSLHALSLACDRLRDGEADLMLAGAVSACDDLFIHVGFTALQALSPTGQSRPFHADADGLVPGEGAACVALMRLSDARERGLRVLGVIRGIGLGNDGKGGGLLAPDDSGQVRAMRAALAQAGWSGEEVRYVECHATGTQLGDAVEIRSTAAVYPDRPVGSLKGTLGHLITASGAAGLLKLLGALEHGVLPATLTGEGRRTPALDAAGLRVVDEAVAWEGPRRAALSAFGFGGNNAHLLVEDPALTEAEAGSTERSVEGEVVVVGLGVRAGPGRSTEDFVRDLQRGRPALAREVHLPIGRLRVPPRDLADALPQQTLLLEAALDLDLDGLPAERTGVYIGMECDPAGALRIHRALRHDPAAIGASAVLGMMPNVVANRLTLAFDLQGPAMSVSSGEASGLDAARVAARALRAGEIDAALVGAVDLTSTAHEVAAHGPAPAGDAAVILSLTTAAEAERRGLDVLAILADEPLAELIDRDHLAARLGHAFAASGLVQAAAAIVRCATGDARGPLAAETPDGVRLTLRPPADAPGLPAPRTHAGPPLRLPAHPTERAMSLPPAPSHPSSIPSSALPSAAATSNTLGSDPGRGDPPAATPNTLGSDPGRGDPGRPGPHPGVPGIVAAAHAEMSSVHQGTTSQAVAGWERLAHVQRTALELIQGVMAGGAAGVASAAGVAPVASHVSTGHVSASDVSASDGSASDGSASDVSAPAAPSVPERAVPVAEGGGAHLPFPWDRQALITLAGGRIADVFGEAFASQDAFDLQVRMPEPPLLLADRITGMKATPLALDQKGSIWSESDIHADRFDVHHGFCSAGMMIESGQADLLLISFMGIDAENRGERRYRLLGCELTFHDRLARVGETLRFDIHCGGHAQAGPVRLFFFESDCRIGDTVHMSVRRGQAGFFTQEELDDTAGVLWKAVEDPPDAERPVDPPAIEGVRARAFSAEDVRTFAAGDAFGCFGEGFERAGPHVRTPSTPSGRMQLFDEVTTFDPAGGPWGRGYLCAVDPLTPDDWFFDGHFKNDPCMPGTLMLDGGLQAMAFYLAALGFTVPRDGWRFEPVHGHTVELLCRGQATPSSREVRYEIFVRELRAGPEPVLFADILGSVDGMPAFHARDVGLRLVPDWPLDALRPDLADHVDAEPVATMPDGHRLGLHAMMAAAWGRPDRAFGSLLADVDPTRGVPRLPGEPYHFVSRITETTGVDGAFAPGATVTAAYDVPRDAWYLDATAHGAMPFPVLLEAALQPCGWLAVRIAAEASVLEPGLRFRNLDGEGTLHREVRPGAPLRTTATMTRCARSGGVLIVGFDVTCTQGGEPVYDLQTVFGFFPEASLLAQRGVPLTPEEAERAEPVSDVPPRVLPAAFRGGVHGRLRRLDVLDGVWPDGGAAGLGRLRAHQAVDPRSWSFRAHFFGDPVQPGSLGLEALLQGLRLLMVELGLTDGLRHPVFEPLGTGAAHRWTFRGQVVPDNGEVLVDVELTERGERHAVARGSLWVDGARIYVADDLRLTVRDGGSRVRLSPATRDDPAVRLLALPPLGGRDGVFSGWATHAPDSLEVRAVRRERRPGGPGPLQDVLDDLTDAVQDAAGDEPFVLFGYSFGAVLAGCVALTLRRRGARLPDALVVAGCDAPDETVLADLDDLASLLPDAILADADLSRLALSAMAHDAALARQVPAWADGEAPLSVPIVTVRGEHDPRTTEAGQQAWSRWTTSDPETVVLPGDHDGLLASEALREAVLEALDPAR